MSAAIPRNHRLFAGIPAHSLSSHVNLLCLRPALVHLRGPGYSHLQGCIAELLHVTRLSIHGPLRIFTSQPPPSVRLAAGLFHNLQVPTRQTCPLRHTSLKDTCPSVQLTIALLIHQHHLNPATSMQHKFWMHQSLPQARRPASAAARNRYQVI